MAVPHTKDLFDLSHTLLREAFEETDYPWQILPRLGELILALGEKLPKDEYDTPEPGVWIHRTAVVFPNAYVGAPCIIGAGTEVRPGAFVRGSALIGEGAVVGNSTEIKNAVLFDGVQVPHYNYVGDSVLGCKAHMGAGVIASNFKGDHGNVSVKDGEEVVETGLRKLGAILGDGADVGCNSVLCPGSVVGRGSRVYPLTRVRGCVPAGVIVKGDMDAICPIR
ncbi:MAG: UDP-N-acetylglucosamine pyrophosphorylase [Clostridia bacterium]|nr:UDP-N-acetylglucosamine pyrophosphorylase [Clostridia bacterium]